MMISDEMVEKIKGTKPEDIATQAEVDEINYYLWKPSIRLKDLENKTLIIKNTQHLQGLY
jgi:hypothetical protein